MAIVLKGLIEGMRPVAGTIKSGIHQGDPWQFLSLEITDTKFGKTYSCQLRDNDPQFKEFVKDGKLLQDWSGHEVKALIRSIVPGEKEVEDKDTGDKRITPVVRISVTKLHDEGVPQDDYE